MEWNSMQGSCMYFFKFGLLLTWHGMHENLTKCWDTQVANAKDVSLSVYVCMAVVVL